MTYRGEQNPRPSSSGGRPFFDRNVEDFGSGRGPLAFEARTAYSEQFAAPSAADRSRAVPSDRHLRSQFELHPRGAKFDGNTTYDLSRPVAQVAQQQTQPRPQIKFEGVSQTHADFGRKQRDPTQPLGHRAPEAQGYVPSDLTFEGMSTTQESVRESSRRIAG
jgi:hypothetical protein